VAREGETGVILAETTMLCNGEANGGEIQAVEAVRGGGNSALRKTASLFFWGQSWSEGGKGSGKREHCG